MPYIDLTHMGQTTNTAHAGVDSTTTASSSLRGHPGGIYATPSMRTGGAAGGVGCYRDGPVTFTCHQRLGRHSRSICENSLGSLDGHVAKVYVGRDRDMGAGKGFPFVGFEERAVARQAIEKVDGKGYVNFILSIQ
jgi:hypothetical protein